MIYTGYIDSEREPIKVGDYMASPKEHYVGQVLYNERGFMLVYIGGGTFDKLKHVANYYHIITEDYAKHLYEIKIKNAREEFYDEIKYI